MIVVSRPSFSMHIHLSFFIFALIFGILLGATFQTAALVMGIIFLVFFIHEVGSTIMGRLFRRPCSMAIWATGGETEVVGPPLRLWQRCSVSLAGLLATYLSMRFAGQYISDVDTLHPVVGEALFLFFVLSGNWFWLNASPLYPYDGGRIMVDLATSWFGRRGEKVAAWVSIATAVLITLYTLSMGTFLALFFVIYSLGRSYSLFKRPAYCQGTAGVTEDEMVLHDLQERWLRGEHEDVIAKLRDLSSSSKEREVRQQAVEWCGEYLLLLERHLEAYEFLMGAKDPLTPLALEHVALAAYKTSHFLEGLEACRAVFTARQTLSVALLAAMLAARCGLEDESVEWLQAARELGLQNVEGVVASADFDPIRASSPFKTFLVTPR